MNPPLSVALIESRAWRAMWYASLLGGVLLLAGCGLSGRALQTESSGAPGALQPGAKSGGAETTALPTPTVPETRTGDGATSMTGTETRPGNPAQWGEAARLAVGRSFDPVYFEFDSADLSAVGRNRLREYAAWLQANPRVWMVLEGNCDSHGSAEYNYNLGMARSLAVQDYLVGLGLDAGRLFPISFGEDRPAALEATTEADALNRRVEFLGFVAPEGESKPKPVTIVPVGAPEKQMPPTPPKAVEIPKERK